MPVNAFAVALCGLVSLPILNLCFRISCCVLVTALYCFGNIVP